MEFPTLTELDVYRTVVQSFGGYNANTRISEGEWAYTKNMSVSSYPVASTRAHRTKLRTMSGLRGYALFWNPHITSQSSGISDVYVNGSGEVFIDGVKKYSILPMAIERQFVLMGGYMYIFPDGFYFNTMNTDESGLLSASFSSADVTYRPCTKEGKNITLIASDNVPSSPASGAYWLDIGGEESVLKRYSASTGEWVTSLNGYIKISASGIDADFEVGDGVTLSGCSFTAAQDASEAEKRDSAAVSALNSEDVLTSVIVGKGDGYIVVKGLIGAVRSQDAGKTVMLERSIPEMDFVIAGENRLWGCRYGSQLNEIYACKLGDPKNWRVYEGLSTDSYAVSLGSDGEFTGAVFCGGYPLFFKENCIHKIYGTMPSNYQLQTVNGRGVQKGSSKSLVNMNEAAVYKSVEGVCLYDGSGIYGISEALGNARYYDACAGAVDSKYYISMRNTDGWHMFVYDSAKQMWMREDGVRAKYFVQYMDNLRFADENGVSWGIAGTYYNTDTADEGAFDWEAVTGVIGYGQPDNKYISRFNIRAQILPGATMDMWLQYDSSGVWEHAGSMTGHSIRTFTLPVRPRRCDHMQIRFTGTGDAKIFSVAKLLEEGSDR